MKFRLLETYNLSGKENMAIDQILLNSKDPVLRFYTWQPSCISLGKNQSPDEINQNFCKANNIDIVKRITGGKTVFHDNELTYSIIISKENLPDSVIESYNTISTALIIGLEEIGLCPSKNNIKPETSNDPNCFLIPSYNEIIINNKKIVGSAQRRIKDKVLQHGSILLDIDFKTISKIFNNNSQDILIDRITSINKELGKEIQIQDLLKSLKIGFQKVFNAEFINSKLTEEELEQVRDIQGDYVV